jgi:hypothetical protein
MSNAYTPGLDPTTMAIIQMLLAQGGGAPPWQGAAGADVLGGLSLGFEPNVMQQDMLGGFALPPSDPDDVGTLEDQKSRFNAMQDFNSLMADPMTLAYTGLGGASMDAFAPTVERELIPQVETRRFEQWQQDPTSFEGWVATRVAQGKSPRAAIVEMRQVYERGTAEDATPEQQADAEHIRLLLTPGYPEEDEFGNPVAGAVAGPNWGRAFEDADKLVQPYLDEQQDNQVGPVGEVRDDDGNLISAGGEIVQGDDGNLYRVTTTDSPLAEKYHELGIPLPTEQYEPGDLLGAEWQQADELYRGSQGARDDAFRQMEQDRDRALSDAAGLNPAQTTLDLSTAGADPNWTPTPNPVTSTGKTQAFDESATITKALPLAPVVDTNSGIVTDPNNPWPGLDPTMIAAQEAQRLRLEQERIAREENPQQSEVFWQNALASVLGGNRPAGAPQASTPITAAAPAPSGSGSIASPINYTIDPVTGQPVAADNDAAEAATALGGSGAAGLLLQRLAAGTEPQPPTPGTVDWSTAIPGGPPQPNANLNLYEQGLATSNRGQNIGAPPPTGQQQPEEMTRQMLLQIMGQQPAGGLESPAWQQLLQQSQNRAGAYEQNQIPVDSNTLAGMQQGRAQDVGMGANLGAADWLPQPQQGGGVLGIGDYLNQYVVGGGTQPHAGPPAQPAYNPLPSTSPQMTRLMLQQIMGQQPAVAPTPQQQAWDDTADRMDQQTLRPPLGSANDPASRSLDTPTGGRVGGRTPLWSQLQPDTGKQLDQAQAQQMLRFMLGGSDQGGGLWGQLQGGGGGKQTADQPAGNGKLSFGGRRATPGETYRASRSADVRSIDRDSAWARYNENMQYRNTYGRDFYQARGYTNRLRQLGITPTQVALASRSGAIRTQQGY